jgi:hypothetical protein
MTIASEQVGYGERTNMKNWYDEECQIKEEERNEAQVKMLNRKTRLNIENYKINQRTTRKSVERIRGFINLKCWKVWRKHTRETR